MSKKPQPTPETEKGLPLTLESRAVFYPEFPINMWSMGPHNKIIEETMKKSLPDIIKALSHPVKPASKEEVQEIFRSGPASEEEEEEQEKQEEQEEQEEQWKFIDKEGDCYSVRSCPK